MRRLAALVGSILLLTGCGGSERSFRQVQFCLNGQDDIAKLKNTVRAIALSEKMEFTDRSEEAEAELESINADLPHTTVAHPTVLSTAHRDDGLVLGVTNFPEAPFQVVMGFSNGRNEAEARQFAAQVVQILSTRWVIHEVPEDRGAFPLKRCDFVTHSA